MEYFPMGHEWIDFRHVKENATFEPILEHYGLKAVGRGEQRAILCPFHNETKPSCKVNLDKKAFNCFGCGAHGNILEFVVKMEECDLRSAAALVAEWCGIDQAPPRSAVAKQPKKAVGAPKERRKASRTEAKSKTTLRVAKEPEAVNPPLTFQLKLEPEHPFLSERGVSPEVVSEFGLGYCSRGLLRERIAIPIHNAGGELVAYAGRWADAEVPERVQKYLLPPKFQKSRVLYNLHRIGKAEHLVIVESYWSVFRLHPLGIPVVSLMGRSISEEQVRLLAQFGTPFLTLMLDGDEPGRTAVQAALPMLALKFFVHVAELPDGIKPHTADEGTLEGLVWQP
jgi:DNA primase